MENPVSRKRLLLCAVCLFTEVSGKQPHREIILDNEDKADIMAPIF